MFKTVFPTFGLYLPPISYTNFVLVFAVLAFETELQLSVTN